MTDLRDSYDLDSRPRRDLRDTELGDMPGDVADVLDQALTTMLEHAEDHGVDVVGIPQIGAGIGGLRWPDVRVVIEEVAATSPVRVVVVSLPAGTR